MGILNPVHHHLYHSHICVEYETVWFRFLGQICVSFAALTGLVPVYCTLLDWFIFLANALVY